jgi:hypothetical protein
MPWPTASTAVAGTTIPVSDHNELLADMAAINGFVRKTADESVTSSTTLQDDDHLLYAIGATGTFIFDAWLYATSAADAAGDLAVGFTFPTATCHAGVFGLSDTLASGDSGSVKAQAGLSITSGAVLANLGLSTSTLMIHLHGILIATATGTLRLQWAQASSSASASTVKAGSHMLVRQVA